MIEHKYHYLFIILGCLLPSNILNTFNSEKLPDKQCKPNIFSHKANIDKY